MNKNLTELVFILDRSGSMSNLESDTIGGYNSMLDKHKKQDGEAMITTVLFDDEYDILHDHADIKKISHITEENYYARGMTALLDAIGKTINLVGNRHKYAPDNQVPKNTLVVIITDGFENSSTEFNVRQIKNMITRQKEKYGWEFIFLGANIDAVSVAGTFGISSDKAVTYKADREGTRRNFDAVSNVAKCIRMDALLSKSWKESIEEYNKDNR